MSHSSLDPLTWHRCRCRTLGASLPGSSTSAGTGSPSHTLTWPALWHASPRDTNIPSHHHAAQELYIQHVNTSLLHRHTTIQLAYMSCGGQSLRQYLLCRLISANKEGTVSHSEFQNPCVRVLAQLQAWLQQEYVGSNLQSFQVVSSDLRDISSISTFKWHISII